MDTHPVRSGEPVHVPPPDKPSPPPPDIPMIPLNHLLAIYKAMDERLKDPEIKYLSNDASAIADATGLTDLVFGNFAGEVRRVTVSGLDPSVEVAFTTARLYVGGGPVSVGDPFSMVDTFSFANGAHIPNVGFYDSGQIPVRLGEKVTLRVRGMTAGVALVGKLMYKKVDL